MLAVNLQKIQKYLDKLDLVLAVSWNKDKRLDKLFIVSKDRWMRDFNGKFK